ncbi:MAG: Uma2 family endonuclease [Chloroflexi bacterium]|nr:Uma2 family endonuclease [Chloroflexota bacterium]
MADKVKYTVDEFDHFINLPENDARRFELIDGDIVEKMPTFLHSFIVSVLMLAIGKYLEQNPIAWILPELRSQLPNDDENALIPDLSVVLKLEGRKVIRQHAPYMPEIAIEVQSPNQSEAALIAKAHAYVKHGAKVVWLVLIDKQAVLVLTATGQQLIPLDGMLSGGDVLPGFSIPVASLFPVE